MQDLYSLYWGSLCWDNGIHLLRPKARFAWLEWGQLAPSYRERVFLESDSQNLIEEWFLVKVFSSKGLRLIWFPNEVMHNLPVFFIYLFIYLFWCVTIDEAAAETVMLLGGAFDMGAEDHGTN